MDIRKSIKSLLIIFVVVSLGVLIYKEFTSKSERNAPNIAETKNDITSVSGKSLPVPESQPSKELATKQKVETPASRVTVTSHNGKVIAYYFHGTFRCSTCQTIEKYSKEAIEFYFTNELKNGILEFKPVNVEEPENKHFIQDYQLVTRSLVLSLVSDGKEKKWKNLPDVWNLVNNRENFFQYVKDEVEKFHKET